MEFFKIWMGCLLIGLGLVSSAMGLMAIALYTANFYPGTTLTVFIIGMALCINYMMAKDEYDHRKRFK